MCLGVADVKTYFGFQSAPEEAVNDCFCSAANRGNREEICDDRPHADIKSMRNVVNLRLSYACAHRRHLHKYT